MLLLVSVLGLCVNLLGVFAFSHGHSHGGDDDSHGHSHGGGHAHEKKKSKHNHGHSHSHGGGNSHSKHKHEVHDNEVGTGCDSFEDNRKKKGMWMRVKEWANRMLAGPSENMSGIWLHVLADTMGSVGVIASSILIMWFDWHIADPICSFCIALMILLSVIPLLSKSGGALLQRTPSNLEDKISEKTQKISGIHGVVAIRKIHVWKQAKDGIVCTLHVRVVSDADETTIRKEISSCLEKDFKHLTIQIEKDRFFELARVNHQDPFNLHSFSV